MLSQDEIKRLKEATDKDKTLEIITTAALALQDKTQLEAIDKSIRSVEQALSTLNVPKSETAAIMKAISKDFGDVIVQVMQNTSSLEQSINQNTSHYTKMCKIMVDTIDARSESLALLTKEVCALRSELETNKACEWVFSVERDQNKDIHTVRATKQYT